MATELGANTEREIRAQRRRSSDPTATTPRRKKARTGSRLVVETDDGGQLELMTDDVRVTSGNTPHEARASRGVTADTGFDDGDVDAGDQEEKEQDVEAEQHDESDDETLDLTEDATGAGTRGQRGSPAPRATPQPPPAPRMSSPAPHAATPPPLPVREGIREYRGPKKMRLPVFKGLDGTMPISTWLRAVQTETRR